MKYTKKGSGLSTIDAKLVSLRSSVAGLTDNIMPVQWSSNSVFAAINALMSYSMQQKEFISINVGPGKTIYYCYTRYNYDSIY